MRPTIWIIRKRGRAAIITIMRQLIVPKLTGPISSGNAAPEPGYLSKGQEPYGNYLCGPDTNTSQDGLTVGNK
jgi:hypothetical protein